MKKQFLKRLAILLAMILVLGVTGCGKDEDTTVDNIESADTTSDANTTDATVDETSVEPLNQDAQVPMLQTAFIEAENLPTIQAKSAILVEQSTGTILFDKAAKEKMYPASMTKMLTALVVLDYLEPDELITVGSEINEVTLDSSKAGHIAGETLTVKNLIRGLIIPSGNDSANVLAVAVAKKVENNEELTFADSQEVFADLMNDKAKELGAVNSHFTNAHGYHNEDHYSCAYDMALFACAYLENETLAEIADEKSFEGNGADNMFPEDNEDVITQEYAWRSHNLLITDNEYKYSNATGIKTGFTNEAGDCVSAAAEKDGETLIAIVFNSEDPGRWTDAKTLFDFGYDAYEKVELATPSVPLEQVQLVKHNHLDGDTLDVVPNHEILTYLPKGTSDAISKTIEYDASYLDEDKDGAIRLKAPIEKDSKVGTVSFEIDGETVLTEDVYAAREVEKGTIWSNIKYFFTNFTSIVFSKKGLIGLGVVVALGALAFGGIRFFGSRNRKYSRGYTLGQPISRKRNRRGRRKF